MGTRSLLGTCLLAVVTAALVMTSVGATAADAPKRPNLLFAIADDWSRPHAGAYGDPGGGPTTH